LSSKPKKPKAEKKAAMSKEKTRPTRPTGKVPEATVVSRHGTGTITRLGRGFSDGELTTAGLEPRLASRWGLILDPRRRSVIQGNVESLSAWSSHSISKTRGAGRVQKVEEEVEKVGREVEKEAVKVEKVVVKVAKEVKEEAAKEEKAVRKRVAKPKAKKKEA
jgi:ribosomal protein L13E